MAMTKCKECRKEVSTSAKACPHCDVEYPGVPAQEWQMTKCNECGKEVLTRAKACPHCDVKNPGVPTTKCKECEKKVLTSANVCPHCGVESPGISDKELLVGQIILIAILLGLLGLLAWGLVKCTGGDDEKSEASKQAADAFCRQDLQCWGDKHNLSAGMYCDIYVEKLAKYSHEWTDGMLEPKFSQFQWKDKSKGYITYIGDKIKFQNGFGSWENYIYECDLNPKTKRVLDVRVRAGRL